MARDRSLKPKNLKRLSDLELAHPGTLTEEEQAELEAFQALRAKHG